VSRKPVSGIGHLTVGSQASGGGWISYLASRIFLALGFPEHVPWRACYENKQMNSGRSKMAERVYKKISVTGCSEEGYEKAIEIAVAKASESLHGLAWFEVKEFRGGIGEGGALEYQAAIDVSFKVD
jgi:flavin-binding protein dodecin